MATSLQDLDEQATHLLNQAAATHSYLQVVVNLILKFENDLQHDNVKAAEDDVDKAIGKMRSSIGRTERYLDREGKHVIAGMEELRQHIPGKLLDMLNKGEQQLDIYLKTLEKQLSRGAGYFRNEFTKLKDETAKLEQSKDIATKQRLLGRATKLVNEVKQTQTILLGIEANEQKYDELLKYLIELVGED
ncbi:TPA: hypothetical protein HA278_07530 [Candidatus Woesearchaeota archaeon]|nr:hypothetical protein [archaeon]HIJ11881.1 hypothetical protein [Candidatus Woesearchaeota archaeon]|tara:strand:- start:4 stop:573 length:570 start_codon:yes stop_codon:yes gene_type:complete